MIRGRESSVLLVVMEKHLGLVFFHLQLDTQRMPAVWRAVRKTDQNGRLGNESHLDRRDSTVTVRFVYCSMKHDAGEFGETAMMAATTTTATTSMEQNSVTVIAVDRTRASEQTASKNASGPLILGDASFFNE